MDYFNQTTERSIANNTNKKKTAASKSLSKREFGVVESNKLRTPQTTSNNKTSVFGQQLRKNLKKSNTVSTSSPQFTDAETQTNSKCNCESLEVYASKVEEITCYKLLHNGLQPLYESVVSEKSILEEQESGFDLQIDEIEKKNEELQQAVNDGYELADALVEKDEQFAFDLFAQVEELIKNENSEASSEEGDCDNGLSVDEILSGVNDMLENDKKITPIKENEELAKEDKELSEESEAFEVFDENSNSFEEVLPSKNGVYIEASTCCTCDWSNEEHVKYMTSTENDEVYYRCHYKIKKDEIERCRKEIIPKLKLSVAEKEEKLSKLKSEQEELIKKEKVADKLYELVNNSQDL